VKSAPTAILNANKSAKLDVVDYAAQHDCLPRIERLEIPASRKSKPGHYIRVSVPGVGIVGKGYHSSLPGYAEIAACYQFKKLAEREHQGETMHVKDINTLTSQTGEKFIEYCKMRQRDWEQYRFEHRQVRGFETRGELYLGDRLVSECVMFSYSSFSKFSDVPGSPIHAQSVTI
jgi:hypothetical protein